MLTVGVRRFVGVVRCEWGGGAPRVHVSDGTLPCHDWATLARSGGTIVAYMAGRTLDVLADRLMAAGMPGATPSGAVENVSRPDERHGWGSLAELGRKLAEAAPQGPTSVLIGAMVDLARTREAAMRVVA